MSLKVSKDKSATWKKRESALVILFFNSTKYTYKIFVILSHVGSAIPNFSPIIGHLML